MVPNVLFAACCEDAASRALVNFISARIKSYGARNDPLVQAQSDLSPYFHFGHLAPQRAALSA